MSTTGNKIDGNGVNHPKHYNVHPSGVECIDIVRHMTFNVGTAIKHLWRAGLKDGNPTLKDLEKAAWYIADEIKRVKEAQLDPRTNPICGNPDHGACDHG